MAVRNLRSKKGMFFTLISILMVSVLFMTFSPRHSLPLKEQIGFTESRISTVDDFVEIVKSSYVPMALRMASYNALNALSEYLKQREADSPGSGLFSDYNELNKNFAEVMLNGSIYCEIGGKNEHIPIDECLGLGRTFMDNRNFTQRLRDIENSSKSTLQIETNFSRDWYGDYNVVLFQNNGTGPFQVGVNLTINISVNAGIAWWNNTERISTVFSFDGIEDPVYSVKSQSDLGGIYTNVFNQTNLTSWNVTNTFKEIEWRRYRYDSEGSSFLTRFTEADENSECCGIESFINPFVMASASVGTIEKPYVDWCFFGTRCPLNQPGYLWNISCITDTSPAPEKFYKFALDTYHADSYNLTDYVYTAADPLSAEQCSSLMQAVCNIDPDTDCD